MEIDVSQPDGQMAVVSVNSFKLNGNESARVVDLDEGPNTITIVLSTDENDGEGATTYTLEINRLSDTAPAFGEAPSDVRVAADEMLAGDGLELPMATGGNGELTYSVNEDALPLGLVFNDLVADDPMTEDMDESMPPRITGTPELPEGFESDFYITYKVADEDANTADTDADFRNFRITVTYEETQTHPTLWCVGCVWVS